MSDTWFVNYDEGNLRLRFKRWDNVKPELRRVVAKLAIQVQGAVKEHKLSGQVLHVRTGRLRRSINQRVVENEDGVMAIVGTNVVYAHPHEYGFSGVVNVRSYTRRSPEQMAVRPRARVSRSAGTVTVHAHSRQMNLPERSFLRSTLRDWGPRIIEDIRAAVRGQL